MGKRFDFSHPLERSLGDFQNVETLLWEILHIFYIMIHMMISFSIFIQRWDFSPSPNYGLPLGWKRWGERPRCFPLSSLLYFPKGNNWFGWCLQSYNVGVVLSASVSVSKLAQLTSRILRGPCSSQPKTVHQKFLWWTACVSVLAGPFFLPQSLPF